MVRSRHGRVADDNVGSPTSWLWRACWQPSYSGDRCWGAIHGYSLNLDRIDIMGASLAGFEVVCEDVDPETLVDELIGLDFLRTRILTIDGVNGQIMLGP